MGEDAEWSDAELARLRVEGLDRLAHLLSGTATERHAAELVAWRMQSRGHEEAFRAAVRLRRQLRALDDGGRAAADGDGGVVLPFRPRPPRPLSRRMMLGGALAASVAGGLVAFGPARDLLPAPGALGADYRTGAGERRLVRLAGGASAELNTRTAARLRHDPATPTLELLGGEALMASRAGGMVALVAGAGTSLGRDARFNARRDGEDVCITCLAGAVAVRLPGEHRLLGARDQVRYDRRGLGAVVRRIDVAALTAWKAGTLVFRALPMRAVVAEINRYRPGHVFLVDTALGDRPLSGTYHVDRLDDFFEQARIAFGVRVLRIPGDIVILG